MRKNEQYSSSRRVSRQKKPRTNGLGIGAASSVSHAQAVSGRRNGLEVRRGCTLGELKRDSPR